MSWSIFATGRVAAVRQKVAGATCGCNAVETEHFEAAKKAILDTLDGESAKDVKAIKVEASGSEYSGGLNQKIEVMPINFLE